MPRLHVPAENRGASAGGLGSRRQRLSNDDATLRFAFPDELPAEEARDLRSQLAILRRQPWSPRSAVEAVLRDWPESEPERTITLEATEQALLDDCLQAEKSLPEASGQALGAGLPRASDELGRKQLGVGQGRREPVTCSLRVTTTAPGLVTRRPNVTTKPR